jgi:hypothetical protein
VWYGEVGNSRVINIGSSLSDATIARRLYSTISNDVYVLDFSFDPNNMSFSYSIDLYPVQKMVSMVELEEGVRRLCCVELVTMLQPLM